ncbi:hypothetical protein HOLleu_17309 [Holothuria leucospilota]|uniref:Uncharacterized protein n=1 Tax=Holothuria leucospilota TaxID=206669 RepID=A0A9Q1HB31_HOLLE|nr:hypothetical protein HOLleu_17309 [Holothuria leucospilota]
MINIDKFFLNCAVVGSNCTGLIWCWLVVCFQLRLYGLQGILWGLSPPLPFNLLCYVMLSRQYYCFIQER